MAITNPTFVFVNQEGKFLRWTEVAGFSTGRAYAYQWGALEDASVATLPAFKSVKWKEERPPVAVALPAKEIRTVEILQMFDVVEQPPAAPSSPASRSTESVVSADPAIGVVHPSDRPITFEE